MLSALLGLALAAHAADPAPTGVLDAVTVFPDRAAITRVLEVDLLAGRNDVAFLDLPPTVDERSLAAEGSGVPGAQLRGLDVVRRELAEDRRDRIVELEGRIRALEDAVRVDRDAAQAARAELAFLSQVQAAAAAQASAELFFAERTVAQVTEIAALLEGRIPELQAVQREAEIAARDKELEISALRRELEATRGAAQWARRDVHVDIEAPAAGRAEVRLTYLLPGAAWTPSYDAHAAPDAGTVELSLSAQVVQTTGEDWSDVALSLSTARPSDGVDPPTLDPFWLAPVVAVPYPAPAARGGAPAAPMAYDMAEEAAAEPMAAPLPAPEPMAVATAAVSERAVATTFEVPGRASVPGDGTRRKVLVTRASLTAEFVHVVVPRFDPAAYLVGAATWSEPWPVLPGEVASFVDGAFVGTSHLDLVGTGGELRVGFGTDDAVKVEVKRLETMTGKPSFGRVKTVRTWRYTLTSGRSEPIEAEVHDRLPRSTDSRYKVKPLGDPPDVLDPQGLTTWTRTVAPSGTTSITFGYQLAYPKKAPPAEVE